MNNTENDKLNVATKVKLGNVQIKNNVTLSNVEDSKITKVLTISAKPIIEDVLVQNGVVKFEGVVDYDLLVVLENNNIVPLTQKSTFSQVYENLAIEEDSVVNIYNSVLEVNNVSSNVGDISYYSLIGFDIYLIKQNFITDHAKPLDDVFVKENELTYNSFIDNVVYDGVVNYEISKDSRVNKILFVNSCATIKSVIPAKDYFVVSGEVYLSIIYSSEDEEIKCINKEVSFSEEIESVGVSKESIIQTQIKTKESVVVENTEKNIFNFDTPIQVFAQVYNKSSVKNIVDAYSLKNEVKLSVTSFEEDDFISTRQVEENILTNFVLSENIPLIDKILTVTPINISIVNQMVKNEELLLEGIANINLIYYFEDDNGNNILNSLDIDLPYSIAFNILDLKENDEVISQICLGDINVKNKRGKELEILAEVKVNFDVIKNKISAITSKIEIGEEKPPKDYALEIYLAKENQTIWDIAKELNMSTADLVSQNSDLTLPITNGERIIAYRQHVDNIE